MTTIKQRREYHRQWVARNPNYKRDWQRRNAEKVRRQCKAWAHRNPDYFQRYWKNKPQSKAGDAVYNALRRGRLVKPSACSECGRTKPLHGHHPDYSKPLEVIWLCRACHLARHGKKPRT